MTTVHTCPNCDIPLEYRYSECGDDDEFCDCDEIWRCVMCEDRFVDPCGAHIQAYDYPLIGRYVGG